MQTTQMQTLSNNKEKITQCSLQVVSSKPGLYREINKTERLIKQKYKYEKENPFQIHRY